VAPVHFALWHIFYSPLVNGSLFPNQNSFIYFPHFLKETLNKHFWTDCQDHFYSFLKKPIMTTKNQFDAQTEENSKLREFFIDQLEDIYWAEKKLVKTLPKLSEAAHSEKLRKAFNDHLTETKGHVSRIEKAFSLLNEDANDKVCQAIKGIVEEGEDIIDETEEGTAQRDVGLIFAGQKAEHYEIATYGGLFQLARTMHMEEVASLLHQTLEEEKKANDTLTQIAESGVNSEAAMERAEN
jgi:ferritin-like metal-binding protein YciE